MCNCLEHSVLHRESIRSNACCIILVMPFVDWNWAEKVVVCANGYAGL